MTLYGRTPRTGKIARNQQRISDPSKGSSYTEQIEKGSDVEKKYASDINGILFIRDSQTDRFVAFKAFLKSFKLDINPSVTLDRSIYIVDPFVSNGQTMFTYKVTLDVPAYNREEAEANLIKMQELFRSIGTVSNRTNPEYGLETGNYDVYYEYQIYFSNLINNGNNKKLAAPYIFDFPTQLLEDNAVSCVIKSIEYKPSQDTGFFETEDKKFLPKHYTLELEFIMTNGHDDLNHYWPFGMGLGD